MKLDFPLLVLLCLIGVVFKRINWKGWFGVGLLVFTWIMFNWLRA